MTTTRDTGAFQVNLELNQGEDWADEYLWEIDDEPVDLTGSTAKMQLRRVPGGSLVLEASTTAGTLTLGGVAGTIAVNIPAATMSGLKGQGVYDLEITFASGRVHRFMEGTFKMKTEVTV